MFHYVTRIAAAIAALAAFTCVLLLYAVAALTDQPNELNLMPWKTNTPIVDVRRERYQKHPRPKAAAGVTVRYIGLGLVCEEIHAIEAVSETPEKTR